MTNESIDLKDLVEIAPETVSVKMGRAAVTSKVPTTVYTAQGTFNDVDQLLSQKPLRRPETRRLTD